MATELALQKCRNCGRETNLGRYYNFYYGPDLGDHEYKKNTGNAITTSKVKGRKVDGIAKVFLCSRCVVTRFKKFEAAMRSGWTAFYVSEIMGWPVILFLIYTIYTHDNTDLARGIFVGTSILLAILSVLWFVHLRRGDKAVAKAMAEMSDEDMHHLVENPGKKDADLLDGYTGDVLARIERHTRRADGLAVWHNIIE